MPTVTSFTAFYPSRPFWAVSAVNFEVPRQDGWFYDQMVEEVYSVDTPEFTMKICRDGRILLRLPQLERGDTSSPLDVDDQVRRWGEYLDFLNAFYLLLDSAVIEIDGIHYFNLHEVTFRDSFRVRYEDGKPGGEGIRTESIASVFQLGRYSSSYRPGIPIEDDFMIMSRGVVSREALACAGSRFAKVVASPGSEKTLAACAKSLAEYKVGNYDTSIVLAWFVIEEGINSLWSAHIDGQSVDLPEGRKRVNRERKDFLIGRDFTASIVSNMLELVSVIDHDLFTSVDRVRGYRNAIVHRREGTRLPGSAEATLALMTTQKMTERLWGIPFTPNLVRTVHGL